MSLRSRNFDGYTLEPRTPKSREAFDREYERNQKREQLEREEEEKRKKDPNTIVGQCNCNCEGCRYKQPLEHCGTGTLLVLGSDGTFLSGCRARRQCDPPLPTIHKHGDFTPYTEPCECEECRYKKTNER